MTIAPATCCIVGGGPAGMMLGLLLARAGVRTAVLEKHADFLRDFRGDTVHPSTLRILDELGLLDRFLERPHQAVREMKAVFGDETVRVADLSGLPPRYAFVAFMPQWDFLDFLADQAEALPTFELHRNVEATGVRQDGEGRVTGVSWRRRGATPGAVGPEGTVDAGLVVACDGRGSTLRGAAELPVHDLGAPIDVLWFRVGRDAAEPGAEGGVFGRVAPGRFVVTLDRGSYWQCAWVIAKGGADAVRARGIEAFRREVAALAPTLGPRVDEIASFDDVKLLSVSLDRLERWWCPGLLCIGDAAHAMSPVGGVGINLAIQDAVAAANALVGPLLARGHAPDDALAAVQERRLFPTRVVQAVQKAVHANVLTPLLASGGPDAGAVLEPPLPVRLVGRTPMLQRLLARGIGMGVRPEHVAAAFR